MKTLTYALFYSTLLFFSVSIAEAGDQITVALTTADQKLNSPIEEMEVLEGGNILRLFAYIKISSDTTNVVKNTLYLEWRRLYNGNTEVLSNYNTDKKWLIYDRKLNAIDDYYRVNKYVFASKPGDYIFRVYNKDKNGEYVLITENTTKINEVTQ